MTLHWWDVVGLCGSSLCLAALGLLARGYLRDTDPRYWMLNFLGAVGLLVSLKGGLNVSVLVMESAWAIIALVGLVKALRGLKQAA